MSRRQCFYVEGLRCAGQPAFAQATISRRPDGLRYAGHPRLDKQHGIPQLHLAKTGIP